jgi:hypothetical protein
MSGADPLMGPVDVIEAALAGDTDGIPDAYSANALLLGGPRDGGEEAVCGDLVSVYDDVNLLGVAIKHDPAYYDRLYRRHLQDGPERLGVVDVGGVDSGEDWGFPTETVSDSGDLTGIGIAVTHFVKRWASTPEPTVVCFDSLTPLLHYSDLDRCYRFLDVTTSRLAQVCAVSHAHLNPGAHDEQAIQSLMSVFDAVVERDDDSDEWVVRGG